MRPLPHPLEAEEHADSIEVLRGWIVKGELRYRLRPAGSGASSPLSGVACLPRLQLRWQTLYPARPEKSAPKYIARF